VDDRRPASAYADEPGVSITPGIIKSLYKINNAVGKADNSSQAVAEFEQEYFYPSDIPIFEKKFGLPLQNISRIVGSNHPDTGTYHGSGLQVGGLWKGMRQSQLSITSLSI
jgi:subtilase family serine protease